MGYVKGSRLKAEFLCIRDMMTVNFACDFVQQIANWINVILFDWPNLCQDYFYKKLWIDFYFKIFKRWPVRQK